MSNAGKTKGQLMNEATELRKRIAELEISEAEHKQATEELKEADERLEVILANTYDIVFQLSPLGIIQYVSPKVEEIYGYKPEDLIGEPLAKTTPVNELPRALEALMSILSGKTLKNFVIDQIDANGKTITMEINGVPVRKGGKIIAGQGVMRDITERKRVEEALKEYSENLEKMMEERTKELKESEERYRSLVENALDIIYSVSPDGVITSLNPAFETITGWSRSEWIGKQFASLIHPDDMAPAMELFQSALQEGIPGTLEARVLAKSGEYLDVEVGSAPELRNERLAGFWGIARDITERKRAEEREKQLQAELVQSRRLAAIGELAAGVAHEINNPLTGVLGYSQRLLRKSTDEETSRDLTRVHGEAQRVSKIVENLLTFARRRETKKEHIDVNDVLQRTLELRAYELRTSNIDLEVEYASDLPEVMADFHQMQEVFLNLILNAEQAMGEANKSGKLSIKTARVKGGIKVSFADDGPGISAKNLDSLFHPFFTTRGERGGTGLGLSVCHGIVTGHGGRMHVDSKLGKGSTFFVELPVSSKVTSH